VIEKEEERGLLIKMALGWRQRGGVVCGRCGVGEVPGCMREGEGIITSD
jgi:hypothetical protein